MQTACGQFSFFSIPTASKGALLRGIFQILKSVYLGINRRTHGWTLDQSVLLLLAIF